jgi:hypothetical protein
MGFSNGTRSLKYYKRLNIYKNSTNTVSYNPVLKEAWSYNWKFCSMVNGTLVFNNYNWSPTTCRHQSAVRRVLTDLKINFVEVNLGQTRPENVNLERVTQMFRDIIEKQCEVELSTRVESWAHASRVRELETMKQNLIIVQQLRSDLRLTVKVQNEIIEKVFEGTFNDLSEKQAARGFKEMSLENAASDLNEVIL